MRRFLFFEVINIFILFLVDNVCANKGINDYIFVYIINLYQRNEYEQ